MRELTRSEIEEVSGGVGPAGALIGGITGGAISIAKGGGVGEVISGVAFGATSGFFGGIASAASGAGRYMFGAYAIETGIIGGIAGS